MVKVLTKAISSQAIKHGYRSGLELKISQQLEAAGVEVHFETVKLNFKWPERQTTYCPDFLIKKRDGSHWFCESKGRFLTNDRAKMLLVREQNPKADIRFVFSNSRAKIYKGSKTTLGMWCDKHGFQYADKTIPAAWLNE